MDKTMQKLRHIGSIKDLRPQNTTCTNINHKGLQRTANEYVGERRIYKDLISKTESRHIKFCKQNTAMLIVAHACAQPYHTDSGSHGQLFCPYWGSLAWHSRQTSVHPWTPSTPC